jgi:hypothetical protein
MRTRTKSGEDAQMARTEGTLSRRGYAGDLDVNTARPTSDALFENGPPLGMLRRLGIVKGDQLNVGRRAIFVVFVGWIPLVLLTVVQSAVLGTDGVTSLSWEIGAHARYLVAAPLLVLAEVDCAQRLNAIVRHFVEGSLVNNSDRNSFDTAMALAGKLLNSNFAEITVVALAYVLVAASVFPQPLDQLPAWHKTGGVAPTFSPAGWWHVLISLPLLLTLLLGWMWRLVVWTRLLWLITRLDLRLMASHPDRAAGLGFLGYSVRAFYIVALAVATIIAGRSAHIILLGGAFPTQFYFFNGCLLLAVAALFVAPLLVFTPTLITAWRRGALEYGALADRVGTAFEDKWLGHDQQTEKAALDKPDFSATTDLYSIVANVYAMRLVPIDIKSVILLGIAILLPFVPVVFLALPLEQIAAGLKKLLF